MHSHVNECDIVQLCQIHLCLSSVSFTFFLLHIVHVPAWEQMKVDMKLMTLKGVQHWLSPLPYTSVLSLTFNDKVICFSIAFTAEMSENVHAPSVV